MEQRVVARPRKDFQAGSEDWNAVASTGQRIRWKNDSQSRSYIEVSQKKAIDELKEISVERKYERRYPLYSCNAHDVQTPSGTDKLAAEQDQVSMMLQDLQMYLNGSISNNW